MWHPEFDLDTASVPILVVDVNGDGHNDIVWGRAHNFGLYWLEQDASDPKQRRWIKHAIDTSWGGAHAPLWADLDGDGVPELIVGKRYLPHEGRDPGEYDPLVSYRYQFDPNHQNLAIAGQFRSMTASASGSIRKWSTSTATAILTWSAPTVADCIGSKTCGFRPTQLRRRPPHRPGPRTTITRSSWS